jgi:hypothetical protein
MVSYFVEVDQVKVSSERFIPKVFILTLEDIQNKSIILSSVPANPRTVSMSVRKGLPQDNGIDFEVDGSILSWDGYELENYLEINDVLVVQYE